MTEEERKLEELTDDDLAEAHGEELPPREQMSVIRGAEPMPFPILPDGGGLSYEPVPPEEA
ncbi:MAG TPA: hypothetical protein VE736_10720 [Gaiellaceae bacterium]|jgi:hypothetical protein|nr:hypothetical protein [Gaiellaceae bacterium]